MTYFNLPRKGLVLEWLGDGNVLDTNDGTKSTLTATSVPYADCPVGYQKKWGVFNGSTSKISTTFADSTGSYTIAGSFKCAVSDGNNKTLFFKGPNGSTRAFWGLIGRNNHPTFPGRLAMIFQSDVAIYSSSNFDDNNPHQFVLTATANDVKLWVDNVLEASSTSISAVNNSNAGNFLIGVTSNNDSYFNGNLGTTRFFNRIITESERTALWHEFNRKLAGGSDFGAVIPAPTAYLEAVGEDTFYDVQRGTKATRTAGSVANDAFGISNAISGPNQSWTSVSGDSFLFSSSNAKDTTNISITGYDTSSGNISHGITIYANQNCVLEKIGTMFASGDFSGATINGTEGTKSGSEVIFNYALTAGQSYAIQITGNSINYSAYSHSPLPINDTYINVTAYQGYTNHYRIGVTSIVTGLATSSWGLSKNPSSVTATGINTSDTVRAVLYYPTGTISASQQTYLENCFKAGYPYPFRRSVLEATIRKASFAWLGGFSGSSLLPVVGATGTITGSPTKARRGQNEGLLFASSQYSTADLPNIAYNAPLTIVVKFTPTTVTAINHIVSKRKATSQYHGYACWTSTSGKLVFRFTGADNNEIEVNGTAALTAGETYVLAARKSASNAASGVSLFINGRPDATVITANTLTTGTIDSTGYLSYRGGSYGAGANLGTLVFAEALSNEEIAAISHSLYTQ